MAELEKRDANEWNTERLWYIDRDKGWCPRLVREDGDRLRTVYTWEDKVRTVRARKKLPLTAADFVSVVESACCEIADDYRSELGMRVGLVRLGQVIWEALFANALDALCDDWEDDSTDVFDGEFLRVWERDIEARLAMLHGNEQPAHASS